ncbi:MAG: site-2 protease family protein [Candidatus Omnitrophota bacterium]
MTMILISLAAFAIAITVHEFAHSWMAYHLGDTTAKSMGRLTLNPAAHIDPVGTVILPLLLILSGSPIVFGWAKPVPINVRNFAKPKEGLFLTGLAGPLANIVTAALFAALIKTRIVTSPALYVFLMYAVSINIVLAVFNLIPLPPLDGFNIAIGILPDRAARSYAGIRPYGPIILLALFFTGIFRKIFWPIIGALIKFLIGQ